MAVIGLFTTVAALAILNSSVMEEKLRSSGMLALGVLVPLAGGLLVLLGSLGMFARKAIGFWAAGFGMLILLVLKVAALSPDSKLQHYIWTACFAFLAGEALLTIWRHSRSPAPLQRTASPAPRPGHQSGGPRAASSSYRFDDGTFVPPELYPRNRSSLSATAGSPRPAPPAPKSLAHLDAGDFAPISEEEMRRRAKKVDRALVFRFGLRSQIPPASDERTLLIDKALVAHGLLTPERLVEIHETGETYVKLRPAIQNLQTTEQLAANRAVAEDQAARTAAREQKRVETAARRERHAKDVAQRRAMDIVFLGRSVSGGLSDRRANVEKLTALGLPVLTSPADIAHALGLSIPRLRWLAFHSEASSVSHYVRFTIPKKSGGTRELSAPHQETAAAQRWILINILERLTMRDCAHGFIKGRNIMSNAVPHVRRDAVVNADLKDFFPSITFPRVKGIFEALGYSPAAATVLALLCTDSPRRTAEYSGKRLHVATGPRALPQGACTSPALSNLAARKLDARLEGLARKTGWTYTRYADDLTFSASGDTAAQCGGLLKALRRFCEEESFTVNEKKTRVQRQNAQQTVTGIVVNRRPNVPRDVYRRVRAILHRAGTTGLAAQNHEEHPNFPMYVRGMIAWVHLANPERGKKLRTAWDKLARL